MRWVSVAVSVLLVGSVLVLVRVSTSPPDPATARTRRGKRSGSGRFGKAMQDEEPVLSVLVTGANGYVGSHVMATLDNKWRFGKLRIWASGYPEREIITNPNLDVVRERLELKDKVKLEERVRAFRPDLTLHLAALSSTGLCAQNPELAWEVNVEGTRRLARAVAGLPPIKAYRHSLRSESRQQQRLGAGSPSVPPPPPPSSSSSPPPPLFVLTSTDWVYKGTAASTREDALAPGFAVYGRTKAGAEQAAVEALGGRALVLRSALVYGPPSPINARKRSSLGWMLDTLRGNRQLAAFEDEYRTPVFVGDIARLMFLLLKRTAAAHATAEPTGTKMDGRWQHPYAHAFNNKAVLSSQRHHLVRTDKRSSKHQGQQQQQERMEGIGKKQRSQQQQGGDDGVNKDAGISVTHPLVFNMGGPVRLSRFELAQQVARVTGAPVPLVIPSRLPEDGARPADVSMDSTPLWKAIGVVPTDPHHGLVQSISLD